MEILAKLPCCIKAQIFLYMQHPVATIYRAVYLQPAWCRDAAYLLSHVESLEQAFLCGEYDEMKDVLIAIDEHFRLLKLDLPPRSTTNPNDFNRRYTGLVKTAGALPSQMLSSIERPSSSRLSVKY